MGGDESRKCKYCDQPLYEGSSALKRYLNIEKRNRTLYIGLMLLPFFMYLFINETGLVLLWLPFGVFASLVIIGLFFICWKLPADKRGIINLAPANIDSDQYEKCYFCGLPIENGSPALAKSRNARKREMAISLGATPLFLVGLVVLSITGNSLLWSMFHLPYFADSYCCLL